ncbi:hypothetical protein HY837_06735 [archaeon]|nr:hypothetical protein [archaeon]
MKITIDTKSDSKEEIRRAVELLSNLLSVRSNQPKNIFEDNAPSVSNPFSMFDSNQGAPPQSSPPPNNAFNSMFGGDSTSSNNSYSSSNNNYSEDNKTSKDDDDEEPVIEYY